MLTAVARLLTAPPPPAPATSYRPPQPVIFELPAGARLLVVERRDVPLVRLAWVAASGCGDEPADLAGLCAVQAPLLAGEDEDVRASFGWDDVALATEVLSADLDAAADTLLARLAAPLPGAAQVALWRRRRLGELELRRRQPSVLAEDQLRRAVHGGRRQGQSCLGSTAGLARLQPEHLAEHRATHCRLAGTTFLAAGDLPAAALADRLAAACQSSGWTFEPVASRNRVPAVAPRSAAPRALLADWPAAAQTELCLGHGLPAGAADAAELEVLNNLLALRLGLSLRGRHGYTYHVRSRFEIGRGPGLFSVAAAVATERVGAAVSEMLSELRRLCREPVSAEELGYVQGFLGGSLPRRWQTHQQIEHELRRGSRPQEAAAIAAVDPAGLRALARHYLRPAAVQVVAVGPAAAVAPQLDHLMAVVPASLET